MNNERSWGFVYRSAILHKSFKESQIKIHLKSIYKIVHRYILAIFILNFSTISLFLFIRSLRSKSYSRDICEQFFLTAL